MLPATVSDVISLFYGLKSLQVVWRLARGWRGFWDREVTPADWALANQVAFFVLIPIGVFLHEAGHALATWQVGGQVMEFQWRVFWGYVVPVGIFTPLQVWWIALSGNLMSILLGLLPIPFLSSLRGRIEGVLLYSFARQQLFYALVWYPALTLAGFAGDWIVIYDFSVTPYAQIVLVLHLALLLGLWRLDKSAWLARWRVAGRPAVAEKLRELEAQLKTRPDDARLLAALALGYHRAGASHLARRYLARARRRDPDSGHLRVLQAVIAFERENYGRARKAAEAARRGPLSQEDELAVHRILAQSLVELGQRVEALDHFDAALRLAPDDFWGLYWRGMLKRSLGRTDEARRDLERAAQVAPDSSERALVERELASL